MTQNEQYPVLKEYYFKLKKRDTEYRKVNLKVIFYSYLLLAVALFIIYFTTILNFIFEFSFSLADFISITIFIYAFIASGAWTALATLIIIETMGKKGIWFKKHVEKNLSGDEELYFRIFNVLSHLKKWEDTNNPEHIKLAKKWLKEVKHQIQEQIDHYPKKELFTENTKEQLLGINLLIKDKLIPNIEKEEYITKINFIFIYLLKLIKNKETFYSNKVPNAKELPSTTIEKLKKIEKIIKPFIVVFNTFTFIGPILSFGIFSIIFGIAVDFLFNTGIIITSVTTFLALFTIDQKYPVYKSIAENLHRIYLIKKEELIKHRK